MGRINQKCAREAFACLLTLIYQFTKCFLGKDQFQQIPVFKHTAGFCCHGTIIYCSFLEKRGRLGGEYRQLGSVLLRPHLS